MTKIGVIAEDQSDVNILRQLILKMAPNKAFTIKKFVGHGCGKIRGKGLQWAKNLRDQGCSLLVVIHDLDTRDYNELTIELRQTFYPSPIKKNIIVIPVREIEAWLLSDSNAIQVGLKLPNKPPYFPEPEHIIDPKRKLSEVIYITSNKQKRYINTIHNEHIAAQIELNNIRRCISFVTLEEFLLRNIK